MTDVEMEADNQHDTIERLERANRVLLAFRDVTQFIIHARDRHSLLQGVCDCLIESDSDFSAWIALLDDDHRLTEYCESGLAVDLSSGFTGDPESLSNTLAVADANLTAAHEEYEEVPESVHEAVADKGYHNNNTPTELHDAIRNARRQYPAGGMMPDWARHNQADRSRAHARLGTDQYLWVSM